MSVMTFVSALSLGLFMNMGHAF